MVAQSGGIAYIEEQPPLASYDELDRRMGSGVGVAIGSAGTAAILLQRRYASAVASGWMAPCPAAPRRYVRAMRQSWLQGDGSRQPNPVKQAGAAQR